MTVKEFVDRFLEVQRELGMPRSLLPTTMVEAWQEFVDECADGYGMGIDEYRNDLGIRELIERVLEDALLTAMPELEWVRADIAETDRRFRELLLPVRIPGAERTHWWAAHPPRHAGPELAADFKSQYGIDIDA